MHIGVISSGYEHLPLLPVLTTIDCRYDFFVDRQHMPRSEKSPSLVQERIQYGIDYLLDECGVEQCIIPALWEEIFLNDPVYKDKILPLYRGYVHNHCLPRSLVGKLGIATTPSDEQRAQSILSELSSKYSPSEKQQATCSFLQPFSFWTKALPTRSYFITSWSKKDWLVRKSIKNDLRYFHDAGVDTLIPTSRMFLYYEKILTHQLNRKKIKFHGIATVKKEFLSLVTPSHYSVTVHTTDDKISRLNQKKRTSQLTRGGSNEIIVKTLGK